MEIRKQKDSILLQEIKINTQTNIYATYGPQEQKSIKIIRWKNGEKLPTGVTKNLEC
jgi:hypothetical protein